MYPALFRSLLQTLRRIDRRHELGHTLERAGKSGFIALEGRYPALVAFEKLVTAEKQTYGGLGTALRSYFDDTAKHEGHRVTVGDSIVTFSEGSDTFKALRAVNELASKIEEMAADGAYAQRRRCEENGVQFAVGDVCEHVDYGKVVITGWDQTYRSHFDETDVARRDQPYYRVLCLEEHTRQRYCCQEHMKLSPEPVSLTPGKYGTSFFFDEDGLNLSSVVRSRFPPANEHLRELYPDEDRLPSHGHCSLSVVDRLLSADSAEARAAYEEMTDKYERQRGEEACAKIRRATELVQWQDEPQEQSPQSPQKQPSTTQEQVAGAAMFRALAREYDDWAEPHYRLGKALTESGSSSSGGSGSRGGGSGALNLEAGIVSLSRALELRPRHCGALLALCRAAIASQEWSLSRSAALRLQQIAPHLDAPLVERALEESDRASPAPAASFFSTEASRVYQQGGPVDKVPASWVDTGAPQSQHVVGAGSSSTSGGGTGGGTGGGGGGAPASSSPAAAAE